MTNPVDLKFALRQFTGTEHYHKWNSLFHSFVLTDGAKYLAEEAGAYWLMDAIASHIMSYKDEGFVVAKLEQMTKGWLLKIEDGNDHILARQRIEYSDFPLTDITLYIIPQEMESGNVWVLLLPGEY